MITIYSYLLIHKNWKENRILLSNVSNENLYVYLFQHINFLTKIFTLFLTL